MLKRVQHDKMILPGAYFYHAQLSALPSLKFENSLVSCFLGALSRSKISFSVRLNRRVRCCVYYWQQFSKQLKYLANFIVRTISVGG